MGLLPTFNEGQQYVQSFLRGERLVIGAIRRVGVGMRGETAGDTLHGSNYIARESAAIPGIMGTGPSSQAGRGTASAKVALRSDDCMDFRGGSEDSIA